MSSLLGAALGGLGGGQIGKAVVQLVLDNTQYTGQLAKAQGETKAATGGMGSSFEQFGAVAAAGVAVAATAVAAFVASAIASASEHEQVMAALTAQVGSNTQAFEDQATALQTVSGFQDEAILSADTLLSRFNLTDDQVRAAIPTVLDYARATGKSVPDAAGAVGKALLGNTRALKAVGINYTSTGNAAKDYTNVLALLNEKVGGQAAAYAQTYAGKLEILSAQFDELKEAVGGAIIPELSRLADALNVTGQIVQRFSGDIDALSAAFPGLSLALDHPMPGLELLESGITFLGEKMGITTDETNYLAVAMGNADGSTINYDAALRNVVDTQAELETATKKATRAIQEQRLEQLQAAGGLLGLVSTLQETNEAQRELHRLQQQGKRGTAEYRQAVIDATQAQLEFRTEVRQYIADNPNRSLSQTRSALREMATQAGITGRDFRDALGGPLKDIIGQLGELQSKRVRIQVDSSAIDLAEARASRLSSQLDRLS